MADAAPISVCMIVKNEAGQIGRCLESIRSYVDEICVVDTGSTDGTQDIVRRYSDKFESYDGCNDGEGRITSFSKARQRSFELASKPWVMWIDGDDEVHGAEFLPEIVKKHDDERGSEPAMVLMPYEYAHDHRGNVTCLHYRERLVTPASSFQWKGPVHEVLVPQGTSQMFRTDQVRIVHRRIQSNKTSEPGRNLRILKAHYEEVGERDVRQLYYLGLEYGNNGDLANALKFHKRYMELSGWDEEKFHACLKIIEHYQSLGQYEDAVEWATKALVVREGWAEAYFALARSFYFMAQRKGPQARRNWERCVHFAKIGLSLPPTQTILFVNPMERQYEIHKYLNMAMNEIGDVEGALDSVNTALVVAPDDEGLLLNKRIYDGFLAKRRIREEMDRLVDAGGLTAATRTAIDDLLEGRSVPEPRADAPESGTRPSGESLDVVFYVGFGCEPWNPDTVRDAGIGGSETMVMEMARRLAGKGHRVTVYGDCEAIEGTFDGVRYVHHAKFKDVSCDVFISSRRPHVMDDEFNVKAKLTMCWVHDVNLGSALTHMRSLRIDRFLVLSQWHRDFFLSTHPFVHPDTVIVTRNAIDLSRFDQDAGPRNPTRAVYSSSPDRGLDVAVRAWPRVRERVPGAELHVFYGFQTWEASARSRGDQGQLDLIEYLKGQLEDHWEHGVHWHGRVGQDELAREFLKSGVWAYPTWFSETSCITAMEAQAAGLHIVTSPIAALNETVGDRGTMISGDWLSSEYMDRWVDAVVAHMQPRAADADRQARDRLRQYARDNFGWDALADDWDSMIKESMAAVERDVVPPYKAAV